MLRVSAWNFDSLEINFWRDLWPQAAAKRGLCLRKKLLFKECNKHTSLVGVPTLGSAALPIISAVHLKNLYVFIEYSTYIHPLSLWCCFFHYNALLHMSLIDQCFEMVFAKMQPEKNAHFSG